MKLVYDKDVHSLTEEILYTYMGLKTDFLNSLKLLYFSSTKDDEKDKAVLVRQATWLEALAPQEKKTSFIEIGTVWSPQEKENWDQDTVTYDNQLNQHLSNTWNHIRHSRLYIAFNNQNYL